jgi:hypothetical protein
MGDFCYQARDTKNCLILATVLQIPLILDRKFGKVGVKE